MQAFLYGKGELVEHAEVQLSEVGGLIGKQPVLWLNVDGLGDAATIETLGNLFHFHRLALEDVVNEHQRPKVDDYGEYLFIVVRMVHGLEQVTSEQLAIFLGPNYVVTFQGLPGDSLGPVRERLRQASGKIRDYGPDYLAYSLLDATIDGYYPVIEAISDRLELIEDETLAGGDEQTMQKLRTIKHELMTARRGIWPQREALGLLIRESHPQISAETRIYLRDCYDHVVQLIDLIEVYRELLMDLRDFYMSTVSNRINETMRVLTIVSTVFIPMTFIAGVYGMNFNPHISPWNMPELEWYYGYPFAIALMLGTVMFMVYYFRRQGWIRLRWLFPSPEPPRHPE